MGSWNLDVSQKCKTCGHTMMEHVFLMADVGRCHFDGCDCKKFEEKRDGEQSQI